MSVRKKSILILNPSTVNSSLPKIRERYGIIYEEGLAMLSGSEKESIMAVITGRGGSAVTEKLLNELPSVRVVGIVGASVRKYNPEGILDRGILIINAADIYAEAVAEFVVMQAILGIRNALRSHEVMRRGGWGIKSKGMVSGLLDMARKASTKPFLRYFKPAARKIVRLAGSRTGTSIATSGKIGRGGANNFVGSTFGIVGYGSISKKVIELLKPFQCKVRVCSEYLTEDEARALGVTKRDLGTVLNSDVVSIHRGLSERTRGSFGKTEIELLKPGAVFINISRGEIVDTEALIERLKRNDIFACLDVFENEPLEKRSILRKLPNVFLTSHISGSTEEMYEKAGVALVNKVSEFLEGTYEGPVVSKVPHQILQPWSPRGVNVLSWIEQKHHEKKRENL